MLDLSIYLTIYRLMIIIYDFVDCGVLQTHTYT